MAQALKMLLIAFAMKATFALKIHEYASGAPVSDECVGAVNAVDQKKAGPCDATNGYTAAISRHLEAADGIHSKDAVDGITAIASYLTTCGGVAKACATAAAPEMAIELQMNGQFSSEACKTEAKRIGESTCSADKEETLMMALARDLQGQKMGQACKDADVLLTTCMGLSPKCAYQSGPMMVSIVLDALSVGPAQKATEVVEIFKKQTLKAHFEVAREKWLENKNRQKWLADMDSVESMRLPHLQTVADMLKKK